MVVSWPFAKKPPHEVTLYTRQGCHLCDDAKSLLERHGITPREVDIDHDPALREKFNACVPVVVIDGRERFRGRVNEVLLRRILRMR
jgi:glutaredoxin